MKNDFENGRKDSRQPQMVLKMGVAECESAK